MTTTISKRQNGNSVPTVENLVNRLFEDNLQRIFGENVWNEHSMSIGTVPVNLRETESEYQIDVIAPGCRKEDFKIDLNEKLLTVTFSKQLDETNEKLIWTRNEYIQPDFTKNFVVNDTVDVNAIRAIYQDGVLCISLGKNEKAKSTFKQIEIK
jgi:HSP20 family protein